MVTRGLAIAAAGLAESALLAAAGGEAEAMSVRGQYHGSTHAPSLPVRPKLEPSLARLSTSVRRVS